MISKIDTSTVKQNIDLREMAAQRVELRRAAGDRELCGPCPRCGGADRFHVAVDWFFCRQCHEKRGDAIEFVQWLGMASGFKTAIDMLGGTLNVPGAPSTRREPVPVSRTRTQPSTWQARAVALVDAAHERLFVDGNPGANYLDGRGIEPHVWQMFRLGYRPNVSLPGTEGKQIAPAIVIPWYQGERLRAIRYRFLERMEYIDAEGKKRTEKQTAEANSQFVGLLWGGLGLPSYTNLPIEHSAGRCAEQLRTLILVEGEFNAASIWQTCHDAGVDALSVGGQGQRLTEAMIAYGKRFEHVIAWMDEEEAAQRVGAALPSAHLIKSPGGKDANDLLRAGQLGGFIAAHRRRTANSEYQREKLLWDLYDAHRIAPLDDGALQVMRALASELDKQVSL